MTRATLAVLTAVAVLTTGCTHSHLARNAPGIVDVTTRPETDADREPRDPGEQMLVIGYGAFIAGGIAQGGGSAHGSYALGPEASLVYGTSARSHNDDDFFIAPENAFGVKLGLAALSSEGKAVGPAYGELALRGSTAYGLGLGWAWDIDDHTHGPQVTLNLGPLFVRGTHQLETSTSVVVGLLLGGQHAWVWSR
jgi:hypothetical protein